MNVKIVVNSYLVAILSPNRFQTHLTSISPLLLTTTPPQHIFLSLLSPLLACPIHLIHLICLSFHNLFFSLHGRPVWPPSYILSNLGPITQSENVKSTYNLPWNNLTTYYNWRPLPLRLPPPPHLDLPFPLFLWSRLLWFLPTITTLNMKTSPRKASLLPMMTQRITLFHSSLY